MSTIIDSKDVLSIIFAYITDKETYRDICLVNRLWKDLARSSIVSIMTRSSKTTLRWDDPLSNTLLKGKQVDDILLITSLRKTDIILEGNFDQLMKCSKRLYHMTFVLDEHFLTSKSFLICKNIRETTMKFLKQPSIGDDLNLSEPPHILISSRFLYEYTNFSKDSRVLKKIDHKLGNKLIDVRYHALGIYINSQRSYFDLTYSPCFSEEKDDRKNSKPEKIIDFVYARMYPLLEIVGLCDTETHQNIMSSLFKEILKGNFYIEGTSSLPGENEIPLPSNPQQFLRKLLYMETDYGVYRSSDDRILSLDPKLEMIFDEVIDKL